MDLSVKENKKRIQSTFETLNGEVIAIYENVRLGAQ